MVDFQGFDKIKKVGFSDLFGHRLGSLSEPFWSPLGFPGLSGPALGAPKGAKARKKNEKSMSRRSPETPKWPEECHLDPHLAQKGFRVGAWVPKCLQN